MIFLQQIRDNGYNEIYNDEFDAPQMEQTCDVENENLRGRPKNLKEFIESREFSEKIDIKVDRTRGEIFMMLLKFSVTYGHSATAMTNLFKLINNIFEQPILPNSKYILDKLLSSDKLVEFHAVCSECSSYIGRYGENVTIKECHLCHEPIDVSKSSNDSYFVLIDPSQQIVDLIQTHEHHVNAILNERIASDEFIEDIYDAKMYVEFRDKLPFEKRNNYITLSFNTDGAVKFENSKTSIWPIYLMINELPIQDRLNKLVCCGLWFNKSKPHMPTYMQKFVNLFNKISSRGISCSIKGEEHLIYPYILTVVLDAVARAPVQGVTQFNGKYGCNWCLHPGESDGAWVYSLTEIIYPLRTHEDTVKLMLESVDSEKIKFGVKYPSPLICLQSFDVVNGFIPDYLHCCLEGVAAQMMRYYMQNLTDVQIELLDKKILNIAVPNQVQRLSRKISVHHKWNALEWENFVLYYSIPLLKPVISDDKFRHWLCFAEALYIILQDKITMADLNKANELLYSFVAKMTKLHGKRAMTYNVHLLLHIGRSVLNWGPVWANSTFSFESANKYTLQAIKCARGANHQIVRYVSLNHSLLILEDAITKGTTDELIKYCKNLFTAEVKHYFRNKDILYLGRTAYVCDELRQTILNLDDRVMLSDEAVYFHRMVRNKCLYESSSLRKTRSNNSFACLDDGSFIIIDKFIVDRENDKELTICRQVTTKNYSASSYSKIKIIDEISKDQIFLDTKKIRKICVYMKVDERMYLCEVPNLIHY
uniref:Uncharacterized protein n=1 Tax=Trichogramma kaykai TaxID=54128 RepID=A0ABD2XQK4_9HYME